MAIAEGLKDILNGKLPRLPKLPLPPGWTWDSQKRTLSIDGAQLEPAAGLLKAANVQSIKMHCAEDHVHVEFTVRGGYVARARVAPHEARIDGDLVSFVCDLLDPVDVTHRSALMRFIMQLFDGLFGITQGKLKSLPGLTADGTRFEWTRTMDGLLWSALKLAGIIPKKGCVPMTIENGCLVMNFGAVA